MKKKIFSQYSKLYLKNRIVLPPMTRCLCTKKGFPTKKLEEYYINRAKNNYGLIIIESAAINDSNAQGYMNGLQFHNLNHVKKWTVILKKMKKYNCKVIIQLYHAGRLTVKEITKQKVLSPSKIEPEKQVSFWRRQKGKDVTHFQTKSRFATPDKLKICEIKKIEDSFVNSIKYSKLAGFDGIELHGAHGYLLHSFLDGRINTRDDFYNFRKLNLFKNIITKAKKHMINKIFCFRLSLHRVDNFYSKYDEKYFNIRKIVKSLDRYGINLFHSSEIKAGNKMLGANKSLTEIIRENTQKPIISCGDISSYEQIKTLSKQGANLFAFGRSSMSNKNFVQMLKKNLQFKNNFTYKRLQNYK
jgi:2,4-dienoyl-CoA reductase-like NADH-dependent reductase (Old Yellow Enzyme family)